MGRTFGKCDADEGGGEKRGEKMVRDATMRLMRGAKSLGTR